MRFFLGIILLILLLGCINKPASNSSLSSHLDSLAYFEIAPFQLSEKIQNKQDFKLIDVRELEEFNEGYIDGATLLPLGQLSEQALEKLGIKKDDNIVLYCRSGKRSAKAYELLSSLGYTNLKSLGGGMIHWQEDGYKLVKPNQGQSLQPQSSSTTGAKISFDRAEHDFGEISQFGGIVSTDFKVKNSGTEKLVISSISTSCACTSAEIGSKEILPGEETNLKVLFNPNLHEEPKDKFTRTVFLETNDASNSEAEIKIRVDILEGQ